MKLFEPIELPILYDNEVTQALEMVNKFPNDDDFDVKLATFYVIDNIQPSDESDHLTMVYSNGFSFYVKMKYSDLKKIVDKAMI